jgi:hypothetical protein
MNKTFSYCKKQNIIKTLEESMSLFKKLTYTLALLTLSFSLLVGSEFICKIPYEPGEVLIRFNREMTHQECDEFALKYDQYELVITHYPITLRCDILNIILHLPGSANFNDSLITLYDLIEILDIDPLVYYASRNMILSPRSSTSDPHFQNQWALKNTGDNDIFTRFNTNSKADADISMDRAWRFYGVASKNTSRPVAAILDSGFYIEHEDLKANWYRFQTGSGIGVNASTLREQGNLFVFDRIQPISWGSHGTAVSGVMGATADNGTGIAGVFGRFGRVLLVLDHQCYPLMLELHPPNPHVVELGDQI